MERMFRYLKAEEIECRPQKITENGCVLLLYKDARVDANLLDEVIGPMNWQRHHLRDNANCIVSIWDREKSQWIEKEDTGAESYTEKEKGLASDSFKRACFQWGIGRELYTAPFIYIRASDFIIKEVKGKLTTYDNFIVDTIEITDGVITQLSIINNKTRKVVFNMGNSSNKQQKQSEPTTESKKQESPLINQKQINVLKEKFIEANLDITKKITKPLESITNEEFSDLIEKLQGLIDKNGGKQ